jgi:hypothetical protein
VLFGYWSSILGRRHLLARSVDVTILLRSYSAGVFRASTRGRIATESLLEAFAERHFSGCDGERTSNGLRMANSYSYEDLNCSPIAFGIKNRALGAGR